MQKKLNTRRKFLLGIGTGLTAALAGCSSLDIDGLSGGQSEQNGASSSSSAGLKTRPEDSQYVQDGKMTVGPRLNVYNIENISKDSVTINLRALPNPLADYDIEVYFTPTSEVPTEWGYGVTKTKSSDEYDESQHQWVTRQQDRHTNDGEANDLDSCYTLFAKEHGEKIGSFTVPSGAAGMVSQDVSPPKGLTAKEMNESISSSTMTSMRKREYLQEEYTDWYRNLPSVGDRYRDFLYETVTKVQDKDIEGRIPGRNIVSQNEAVGSYPIDIHPKNARLFYPYQKNIDLDREIPDMVPGVFTFTWTEQPTVSTRAGDVIDQTEQFVRVGSEIHAPPRLGYGNGHKFESTVISDIDTQQFERYFDEGTPSPEKPHFHTKVDDTGGDNSVKHWRTSDYGRHSPEIQEIAKMDMRKDSDETRALRFAGTEPAHLINSGVQNMWGIEYTIPDDVAREAQITGNRVRREARGSTESFKPFKQMYESEEILQHPKLQEVAQKLRRVCDNIGAESKPAQLRIVADFVQYLPHSYATYSEDISDGGRLGDMSDIPKDYITDPGTGGSHPVWTLYGCWGDCEDFTALYNAIVSTDHFDVETVDTAMLTGLKSYNLGGAITSHTTPAVPLDELGVDEIIHNESNADVDFPRYYIPATYEHNGTEYAYIETSSMAPLGMVTGRDAQFVDALPAKSLDSFGR